MKKAISIVLALIMLFAICVPAFAETDISKTGDKGEVTVKTTTKYENGDEAETYSVTIPADTDIAWGTPSKDVGYTVESHLSRNKAVTVTVSGNGEMKTEDGAYKLAYTLEGDGCVYQAQHPVVFEAEKQEVYVTIAELSWKTAVVENYSDVLTYESGIVTVTE